MVNKKQIAKVIERRTINNLNRKITKRVNGKLILDDGGGNGSFNYSKHLDKKIFSIDIKERDLSRFSNVEFKKASAVKIPYEGNKFDCVCYAGVIQYVENYNKSLEEIKRVLKKDGRFIIATVNRNSLFRRIGVINPKPKKEAGEYNMFNFREIIKLLDKHGFKVLKIEGVDFIKMPRELCSNILITAKKN
jgi:ubiquinone/menaquinone biosynthesis C-methylase UbiE